MSQRISHIGGLLDEPVRCRLSGYFNAEVGGGPAENREEVFDALHAKRAVHVLRGSPPLSSMLNLPLRKRYALVSSPIVRWIICPGSGFELGPG